VVFAVDVIRSASTEDSFGARVDDWSVLLKITFVIVESRIENRIGSGISNNCSGIRNRGNGVYGSV